MGYRWDIDAIVGITMYFESSNFVPMCSLEPIHLHPSNSQVDQGTSWLPATKRGGGRPHSAKIFNRADQLCCSRSLPQPCWAWGNLWGNPWFFDVFPPRNIWKELGCTTCFNFARSAGRTPDAIFPQSPWLGSPSEKTYTGAYTLNVSHLWLVGVFQPLPIRYACLWDKHESLT